MKKEIFQEIEIPEGIEVNVNESTVFVKGPEGENKRTFNTQGFKIEKKENKIIIGSEKVTKKEKKLINTTVAHIKNMVQGSKKKFTYGLKICSSHFPITVEIKDNEAIIKNFLGEKIPRKTKILNNVEVNVDKDKITVSSSNKELAGQTAANFEKATRIKMRDRRIFQDGIFITNKSGKEI